MKFKSEYKKITFIDDDKGLADLYKSNLKSKNLSDYFLFFDNAKDGIDYLKGAKKNELPDYLLVDLYMPGMDGFEFLKQVEKINKVKDSVEIYICTSSQSEEDRKAVMKYPFVSAFIEKPIDTNFLEFLITDTKNFSNNSTY